MAKRSTGDALNRVHRFVLRVSRNKLGWRVSGMPVLELTTIGRKSGEKRPTMLTSPISLDGNPVVVGSKGGSDQHPAWFLNLRDNPQVEVATGGNAPVRKTARILSTTERATIWPQITTSHPNYASYQTKTSREIPLVVLEPVQ